MKRFKNQEELEAEGFKLDEEGYYVGPPGSRYVLYSERVGQPVPTTSTLNWYTSWNEDWMWVEDEPTIAERDNEGKIDLSLLPVEACLQEAKVWMYGANKHTREGWKKLWGDNTTNIVMASALRHMFALLDGKEIDEESGCYHAALVRCNMAMLLEHYKNEREKK